MVPMAKKTKMMSCSLTLVVLLLQLGLTTPFQQSIGYGYSILCRRNDLRYHLTTACSVQEITNRSEDALDSTGRFSSISKPNGYQDRWNDKYEELATFYEKHRHLNVEFPQSLYKSMATKRREERNIQSWNAKYEELADFYRKHGHLQVKYQGSLYKWMAKQRLRRKGTHGSPISDKQTRLLDDIEFCWSPKTDSHNPQWNAKYKELADFYKKHGHLKVKRSGTLYNWMLQQRMRRKGTYGLTISNKQIQLLDDIDFHWKPKRGSNIPLWNAKYEELADFYKEHGHLRVKAKSSLYSWMLQQRRRRNGTNGPPMPDEQIRLLDGIGFPWIAGGDCNLRLWFAKYEELADFYEKHGHLKVKIPSSSYNWIAQQRRRRRGALGPPLSDEQLRLLDNIGISWGRTRESGLLL